MEALILLACGVAGSAIYFYAVKPIILSVMSVMS